MSVGQSDKAFLSSLAAAQVDEPLPRVTWALYLLLAALVTAVLWAAFTEVDQLSRSEGVIVPDGREQVIASAEIGILRELLVREGDRVEKDQVLAKLDPTRVEAQQNEGQVKRLASRATVARLTAEATSKPLQFPAELNAVPAIVAAEAAAYAARQRLLDEAVASIERSIGMLGRELKVSQDMAAKGLMSNVEVMHLSRQVNELQQQRSERISRFRQEASSELVRLQNELAMQDEQMVVRDDALKRTVLTSPVRGMVKNIRANTLGGVITTGSPIMEIVPLTDAVLIETKIKPAEVGYLAVGMPAKIKLQGFDYNVYGGLEGRVEYISPDALGEADKTGAGRYYRALVRSERNNLRYKGETVAVIPGMSATVEIKTGERSVLSFLLRPVLKTREALSER
ncbi:HlyD family efflux transporter periplasmic adaptor subunit [Paucibacter sp. DJ2R-2]|uniref:HlyD family efflux transporter periplasmic adaptor subunit n=1 Tax=Paucibacter sp. DJ2R-2 TaxID=2893558 RepID=UPI0021E48D6A|nr:HlyD family efflux transporter periplasmic adaptor subunit [Paucibacter sp. DJ2R-2]MCV2422869.1 HlyD family efflux transporter periplasmic adaptor subunit [Paucibacter sp. DJ4R-1]MCV2440765.1 HlyD family efflux transporter periplasmic adaptor subunit [Paucibacter sp. DJ2R-2]